MKKLVQTPLDDHSCSLYTSLVFKHYSIAQSNFIIAKISFVLKKTMKIFPATTNIPNKNNKALLKLVPPSTNLGISTLPPPTFVQHHFHFLTFFLSHMIYSITLHFLFVTFSQKIPFFHYSRSEKIRISLTFSYQNINVYFHQKTFSIFSP